MARYALVIGVAAYNNFRNLEKAVTDAEAIAQLLERQGNFQEVKRLPAKCLKDESRWVVAGDKKLTGKEMGNVLRTFLLEQAAKNEAVIYFAGHGFPASSCMGVEQGYLATSDCSEDGRNAIPLRDFNTLMVESDLSSLVVMLDCCYAGTLLERQLLEPTFTAFNTKRDYYLVTACRGFQKAYEGVEHGVFTEAILKGLGAENADEKGQVSGDRLFDFIARELKGSGQEPIRMGWGRAIALVQYQPKKTERVVDETCPYQGLEAFGKEQARFFFGREKVVQLLMEKLGQANFVPIIGASGSGKSSVVRAGLIPQLEKNGWRVLEPILSGFEPLAELKRSLSGLFGRTEVREVYSLMETDGLPAVIERLPSRERLLLVVDQFEEVFTVCPKEEERRRFIELLTQVAKIPASRLAIVTTMRADFLEPCLSYESLTRLIQNEAVYMPPLAGAELEEAIASPANLQGYQLETGLLGAILHDLGQEKGCLPLLQFALMELWEQRDQQTHQLTLGKYNQLGGVTGALNRHAEKIYHSFTEPQRDWVKRIFLKLVRIGEDAKDTRQRQPKAKLLAITGDNLTHQEAISKVLDKLVDGRLLVTDREGEDWVDLSHEALMEGWEEFAAWRQEDRQLRRLIDRIEDALREWHKSPQDENLMMGRLLAQVREKWFELEPDLDRSAKDFYQQSKAYEASLQQARTEANIREQADRVLNVLSEQPVEGLILAIRLIGLSLQELQGNIPSTIQSTLQQATEEAREQNILKGHEAAVNSVAFSPDGKYIVSGSSDSTVRLWDRQGHLLASPLRGHKAAVNSVAFSPDGKYIVSGSDDSTVRLWDRQGHSLASPLRGHKAAVNSVTFSPDGKHIVSGSDDGTVRRWSRQGHAPGNLFPKLEGSITCVTFSPDGQRIVSGSDDGTMQLWNRQGDGFFNHDFNEVYSVAFSPNGNYIASGGIDGIVQLWNPQGQPFGSSFGIHKNAINVVTFSPDGQCIVTGHDDGYVRLWNLLGDCIGEYFQGYENSVTSAAFSLDGQCIVSGSNDGTVLLWDVRHLLGNDWKTLLQIACDRLRYHPVFQNPQTEEAKAACETCQKYVWGKE